MRKLIPYLLVVVALAARFIPGPRSIDDSYITFRYARNLVSGAGFVFNLQDAGAGQGERVQGTTTPLYTLLMAGLALPLGGTAAPFPVLALTVNALADAATCLLLWKIGQRIGSEWAGLAAALVWSVAPYSVTFAIGGLETSLYVCLLTGMAAAYLWKKRTLTALCAALALLTRPDAVLLVGLLAFDRLWRAFQRRRGSDEKLQWGEMLAFLLPCLAWGVFATAYFGSPIPHSVTAKLVTYRLDANSALIRLIQHYATPFMEYDSLGVAGIGMGLILYPFLYLVGARRAWRAQPRLLAWLVYPWLYFVVFALPNPLLFRWYLTPPLPAYMLVILLGAEQGLKGLFKWIPSIKPFQPASPCREPLQPASPCKEPLQPASSCREPLQPASPCKEPLQPASSCREPLQPASRRRSGEAGPIVDDPSQSPAAGRSGEEQKSFQPASPCKEPLQPASSCREPLQPASRRRSGEAGPIVDDPSQSPAAGRSGEEQKSFQPASSCREPLQPASRRRSGEAGPIVDDPSQSPAAGRSGEEQKSFQPASSCREPLQPASRRRSGEAGPIVDDPSQSPAAGRSGEEQKSFLPPFQPARFAAGRRSGEVVTIVDVPSQSPVAGRSGEGFRGDRGEKRRARGSWRAWVPLLLLTTLPLASILNSWTLHPDHGPDRPAPQMAWFKLELLYRQAADFLAPRLTFASRLAAGDVGVLGFYTPARILDTVGLNSPESLRYYPLDKRYYVINYAIPADLILDEQPDYVVILEIYARLTLLQDPRFSQQYTLLRTLPTDIYGSRGMLIFARNP